MPIEPTRRSVLIGRLLPPVLLGGLGLALAGKADIEEWLGVVFVATLWVAAMIVQSLRHFSRTGPQLQAEIAGFNRIYALLALMRLVLWTWLISLAMGFAGMTFHLSLAAAVGASPSPILGAIFAALGIGVITSLQFCRHLLFIPGSIEASSNYRTSRFHGLWALLTPKRVQGAQAGLLALFALVGAAGSLSLMASAAAQLALGLFLMNAAVLLHFHRWRAQGEPQAVKARPGPQSRPNILLIGVDSLRHDRLQNGRNLTPNLDRLAQRGVHFGRCYVPCARTAPSLASLLASRWPHEHGIRDNFAANDEVNLGPAPLPAYLRDQGYRTLAISDWCGSDLGKFAFGFEAVDLPEDQWNIRYLLRQGPKDLRLFLSLFTHNAFGRHMLPELYFLAGIPMTRMLGLTTRRAISRFAEAGGEPFFINLFVSSTHAPFGSEYPYYTRFTDPNYQGDSKFVMGGLSEPFEVVHRQSQGKAHFDFEQIIDLYDGCVQAFDDELKAILDHLVACGLAENTLVAVYSDHGMEFFERETWGQGNSVIVDEGARIPLVLYDPRNPLGRRIDAVTRSIDIAPTLLDMAGLAIPKDMRGVSLCPLMQDPELNPRLLAYSETGVWFTRVPSLEPDHLHYPELPALLEIPDKSKGTITLKSDWKARIIQAKDRMICSDQWKLVRQPMVHGVVHKLFDLATDPSCLHDVSAKHPEITAELRRELEVMLEGDLDSSTEAAASALGAGVRPAGAGGIAPQAPNLRISVVIPAYNAARFLPKTLAGIRAQTYPAHEIIIVDDGSRDNTREVVAGLGQGITYVHQENTGVSAARNRGIAMATGDIVAFLDADDDWLPEKLERQIAIFQQYPRVGLVASDRSDIDADGQVLLDSLFKKQGLENMFKDLAGTPLPGALGKLIKTNFLPTSSVTVRKSALDAVGLFNTGIRYGEDLELWARIAAKYEVACVPQVLVLYRLHDSNATQHTEKLMLDMVRVMREIRSWGRARVAQDGLDPDAVVANALWELGYWQFSRGQLTQARAAFKECLKEKPSLRGMIYTVLSYLPETTLHALRAVKQRIAGST